MLTSHFSFPKWNFDTKKIELGPEKWEIGFKRGFSRLKCRPLATQLKGLNRNFTLCNEERLSEYAFIFNLVSNN